MRSCAAVCQAKSPLSQHQINGLYAISKGEVRRSGIYGAVTHGDVMLNSIWSLVDRGMVYDMSYNPVRLTPFGKQVMSWIEKAERYDDLAR
jgi:hypothetical protein